MRMKPPSIKPQGSSRTQPAETSKRIKTLLVDDSPIMLELLERIMAQERGFEIVGTATDGHKALVSAATLDPELVLTDLHLPHLNGAQVTQCLKEFDDPPAVFVVTANDTHAARQMCAAAGADAFVVKSGDLGARLHSKLQEWLGQRQTSASRATSPPDIHIEAQTGVDPDGARSSKEAQPESRIRSGEKLSSSAAVRPKGSAATPSAIQTSMRPLSSGAANSSGKRTCSLACSARRPAAEHFGHPHCDQPAPSSPAARSCASRSLSSGN
jgi:DNA-binding NarL/FixJ family response regulator